MNKKQILLKAKLYVIIDADLLGHQNLDRITSQAIEGGADLIQFRDKSSNDREFLKIAESLKKITDEVNIPFIINDKVDIALYLNTAGVHLGQDDLPIWVAREILGEEKIIGISTSDLKQAKEAQKEGADYIGFGPIFYTQTKKIEEAIGLNSIQKLKKEIFIPFFAIGGINLDNLNEVIKAGAGRIAVVSAVVKADDVKLAVWRLKERLEI